VTVETMRLRPVLEQGALLFHQDPAGRLVRVVTDVNGEAFSEVWLDTVAAVRR
jgi:hypothetical protein